MSVIIEFVTKKNNKESVILVNSVQSALGVISSLDKDPEVISWKMIHNKIKEKTADIKHTLNKSELYNSRT